MAVMIENIYSKWVVAIIAAPSVEAATDARFVHEREVVFYGELVRRLTACADSLTADERQLADRTLSFFSRPTAWTSPPDAPDDDEEEKVFFLADTRRFRELLRKALRHADATRPVRRKPRHFDRQEALSLRPALDFLDGPGSTHDTVVLWMEWGL